MIAYTLMKELVPGKWVVLHTIDKYGIPVWTDGEDDEDAMFFTAITSIKNLAIKHQAMVAHFEGKKEGDVFVPQKCLGRFDYSRFEVSDN